MPRTPAAFLVATLLVTSCGEPAGPDFSTYTLETINGAPLPYPHGLSGYQGTGLDVVSGGFEFHHRGDIVEWKQLRCQSPQPAGTTCQLEGDGVVRSQMIFNALENRVYYGDGLWYPMVVHADSARIQFGEGFDQVYRYGRAD